MFEKINLKIYKTKNNIESHQLIAEELKYLEKIAEQIFKKEFKIGEGEYSHVYQDILNNVCYKVATHKAQRDIHEEAEFYSKLTNKSEKVIVPEPYFSLNAKVVKTGKMSTERRVIAMQKINGANFNEILKGEKELPLNFNSESFFKDLKDFFNFMHNEVGIYHCDFADRNLMIDYDTGKPVIVDFGNSVYKSWFTIDEIKEGKQYSRGTNDLLEIEKIEQVVQLYLTRFNK
ncbi:MAG: AarF/UbiB family protein [Candidatus Paceibacterota bacterium]|jgi:RIO-like serine/threonine protein kinase